MSLPCAGCGQPATYWVGRGDGSGDPYCLGCVNGVTGKGPTGGFTTQPIELAMADRKAAFDNLAAQVEYGAIEVPGKEPTRVGEQLRAKLLTAAEVVKRPPPEALIEGLLLKASLALLYGKPKSYKSFLALDFGLSVAGGRDWGDRTTAQGPVLYVAAEGLAGLGKRIQAWEQAYGHARTASGEDFYVLPERVRLLLPNDVAALVDLAAILRPAMVVLDTLNRSLAGGDENSSRDMGLAVEAADQIRQAGSTVLIVHHADKEGRNYRGHSSLEGAVDTVLRLEKVGRSLTLITDAQKDAPEADRIKLQTTSESVGADTSLVLYCQTGVAVPEDEANPAELDLLATLGSTFGSNGASASQLLKVSAMAERTFFRALKGLVDRGLVRNAGTASRTRYVVVPAKEQGKLP
jgi:AAA domain